MKFQENSKPIYLQIADRICDEIVAGKYGHEERIPSVRDYACRMQVNVNTVMRSFEYLSGQGVIFNRRGLGYFITEDAAWRISMLRQDTFYKEELPYVFDRLQSMDITPSRLKEIYQEYLADIANNKKLER